MAVPVKAESTYIYWAMEAFKERFAERMTRREEVVEVLEMAG